MIKLEHVVLASPEQMEFIIEGMRNPMNSWEKSDSYTGYDCTACGHVERDGVCSKGDPEREYCYEYYGFELGPNDHSLMQRLAKAGTDHRKFMRMMPVYVRITAPLYWWKEFDTYKVGTVANSCSTMHKIAEKRFTLDDFSYEHLTNRAIKRLREDIYELNFWRDAFNCKSNEERNLYFANCDWNDTYIPTKKDCWCQLIQLLPTSYNQTRNVMMDYEVLANIYKSRNHHKLDEWKVHETPEEDKFRNKDFASGKWGFCDWIESLPHSELIVGTDNTSTPNPVSPCKLNIRWAEEIFKNHGIKLTEEQINAINAISATNNNEK